MSLHDHHCGAVRCTNIRTPRSSALTRVRLAAQRSWAPAIRRVHHCDTLEMNLHLKVGRPSCRIPFRRKPAGECGSSPRGSSRTLDGSGRALTSFSAPGNRRHRRRDGHPSRRTTGVACRRESIRDSGGGSGRRVCLGIHVRAEDRAPERGRRRRRPRELHRDARKRHDCVRRRVDEAVRSHERR